ncbi:hypothetical protein SAMN05660493_00805 [Epilithonimonas bovis DSM 19482]|uniref:CarboxypepD_reg-like domain-containing protein n=2 Tax=Epilithonimonas TaxID=2782229 RepID=A0A1U7PVX7_9FLAO|nr:hypothetical protein SAMN05660493_00805 [Epilithonimonas bovis DSM 19482]
MTFKMTKLKYLLFFFFNTIMYAQNFLSGNVLSEGGFVLQNVTIVNMKNGNKTFTNNEGYFKIEAQKNDELRFIKENFERESKVIQNVDFLIPMFIKLDRIPIEIEEVKVVIKPTGDLNKDVNRLKTDYSKEILQKKIGLPQLRGIQREKVPNTSLPLAILSLNPDTIYKTASGEARKMKTLYKYEDMHRNINWITKQNGDEYFISREIPKEKIKEFIEFSILIDPQITSYIKANNISAVNFRLEDALTIYLKRLRK